MNKKILQNIWKDPVWSKVISVAIIGLVSITYSLVAAESVGAIFYDLWNYKVPLLAVGIAVLLFLVGWSFYTGRTFRYDNETLEVDRKLFEQIRNNDAIVEFILEVKRQAFSSGSPVKVERVFTLVDILEKSQRPDFEFINPQLEKLKDKLINEFEVFDAVLVKNIFGARNNGWVSIPREWEYEQPQRMQKAQEDLKIQESILTKSYQDFISKGRKILKV